MSVTNVVNQAPGQMSTPSVADQIGHFTEYLAMKLPDNFIYYTRTFVTVI